MLQFKENFDAQRSESLRAEDMANQKAKQEAASKFTGQMFQNVMGGLNGGGIGSFFQQNSSAITSFFDKLK
jgi:predicted lipid-binding transport protein (Tim44 family)